MEVIDNLWLFLAVLCAGVRVAIHLAGRQRDKSAAAGTSHESSSAAAAQTLCLRYLPCFLVFKAADWLQVRFWAPPPGVVVVAVVIVAAAAAAAVAVAAAHGR
jgi:hypothetical protein